MAEHLKEWVLVLLQNRGCSESSAHGLGACYRSGRFDDARYSAFAACAACMADRAVKGQEDPFTDAERLEFLLDQLPPHLVDELEQAWRNYRAERWDERTGQR